MSELIKPNKARERLDYAKYLLMNTNSSFCQSKMDKAERLMEEIQGMDSRIHEAIPGYLMKMNDLEEKMKAYHSMDVIWKRFLRTKEVSQDELDAVQAARSSCEKQTLAKYSYMTAYSHFCKGDLPQFRNIFENRTLRLTEKTTLRVRDVEGLAGEVANMKTLFQGMAKLDKAWNKYIKTGVSPGFDTKLPLFPCYPIPNMKALVLNGASDVCNSGASALEKISELQAASGVALDRQLKNKLEELEEAVGERENNLTILNKAWDAFLTDNTVSYLGQYGYEYCSKEPLIRAYIMDGFGNVCGMAEESLEKIEDLLSPTVLDLESSTMEKINELVALNEQYQLNAMKIEGVWSRFVAQGDVLREDYESTDNYCDLIHQAKDWTIKGLTGTCEEGLQYLEQIEEFQKNIEFKFYKELECRVQKLRIKVWDCRHQALQKIAKASADPYNEKLAALMDEYGMGDRPEVCSLDK